MAELTLTIPDRLWMSSNQRLNRFDHAARTRGVRALARDVALAANLPQMRQAHIGIFVGYATRVKADPPNAWPTAKAAIDGIVTDAGLLADDSSEFVYCHSFMRDPKRAERGTHTLRLVLTDQTLPWMEDR